MGKNNHVSRAYLKLQFAIDLFNISIKNKVIADFGSSTGGFTECFLDYGAAKIYAIDTAYGELAWSLRNNPKVVVKERTNAIHVNLPEKVDLITIDVGWTKQEKILPNAIKNLKQDGLIITLIKPHYEALSKYLVKGKLKEEHLEEVLDKTKEVFKGLNLELINLAQTPIEGKSGGNKEFIALLKV